MPQVTEYKYGPTWDWLQSRGWSIKPVKVPSGTARANWTNRTIEMLPRAFYKPVTRIVQYVLPHEFAHAVHFEESFFECDDLRFDRDLSWRSAIEVVADAYVLRTKPTLQMRQWVRSSVVWHGRVGYRYGMKDVESPEAYAVVRRLLDRVASDV